MKDVSTALLATQGTTAVASVSPSLAGGDHNMTPWKGALA